MVVAGNVMKALFCTLVGDVVHCLTGDGDDERLVEHVHTPFHRDNTDHSMMDMKTRPYLDEDRLMSVVLTQQMKHVVNWKMAIERRFENFEEFLVRLAEELADYYHLSRLVQQLYSDEVKSLLCDASPTADDCY